MTTTRHAGTMPARTAIARGLTQPFVDVVLTWYVAGQSYGRLAASSGRNRATALATLTTTAQAAPVIDTQTGRPAIHTGTALIVSPSKILPGRAVLWLPDEDNGPYGLCEEAGAPLALIERAQTVTSIAPAIAAAAATARRMGHGLEVATFSAPGFAHELELRIRHHH